MNTYGTPKKRKITKAKKKEILIFPTFIYEAEKTNVNIVYDESGGVKKIKNISLDLFLTKIIVDDLLETNPSLIYHFCQQCFCFLDINILFEKIINCYNYYR